MIKIVSWNIAKRQEPWRWLVGMARDGEVDLALLQEAGTPPGDLADLVEYQDQVFWNRNLYDRWPLIVRLSDRITVTPYRQVPPISELGRDTIGVSGVGTIAAAKVIPRDSEEEAFVAISMYAGWLTSHPSTGSGWIYSDASAHRILSDLSAFIGHRDPGKHRILAAGDLNMIYGATGWQLSLPERERTFWDRIGALGLEFLGPQTPHGRRAESTPIDVPSDTKNLPTFCSPRREPKDAANQLDYAFASRGFHERVSVRAMNEINEWGPSDHCRLMIEVKTQADYG